MIPDVFRVYGSYNFYVFAHCMLCNNTLRGVGGDTRTFTWPWKWVSNVILRLRNEYDELLGLPVKRSRYEPREQPLVGGGCGGQPRRLRSPFIRAVSACQRIDSDDSLGVDRIPRSSYAVAQNFNPRNPSLPYCCVHESIRVHV